MDINQFRSGSWHKGYQYHYFLPEKINHSYVWSDETINTLLEQASLKLGELNAYSRFIPDTDLFIKMHIVKEAVVSSRIEGTQTNMEEVLAAQQEVQPEKRDDWQEVNNYMVAMNSAIDELEYLPLSNRLIKNLHRILLSSVRGETKNPGEFRQSQNWIGGASLADATFTPPAHTEVADLMSDMELFLHNKAIQVPHLIRIAIVHYQFETIHPFLDGNGRVGRLLITLYLVSTGILDKPLLYLSDYFERHRLLYYDKLTLTREKHDLSQWLKFFLTGIIQTSEKSVITLQHITTLKQDIEQRRISLMGRRSKQAMHLLQQLFKQPLINAKEAKKITGLSMQASNNLIKAFVEQNILQETTGYSRNRVFVFAEYMALFEQTRRIKS